MVPAHRKPQRIPTTTIQPESRKYWKARKPPYQRPIRNSEKLADQLAPPYEQEHPAPQPWYKQVRFLLHLCRKESNQPQYHPEPEPLLLVHRHPNPAHPRDPYRLHHHSQQHHNRLQVLHHLTHQQPEPWLNRTNPEFWEQPRNHTTDSPTRLLTFGIPSPIISPSIAVFTPPTPRRSHRPLPTLK